MGSSLYTHIGPYMIVSGKKEIIKDKKVHTCTNENCDNFKLNKEVNSKFCSACGHETAQKKYQDKQVMTASGAIHNKEEFEDMLYGANDNIFISNKYAPFDAVERKKIRNGDKCDINLMSVDMTAEIEWFQKEYQDIIDFAEQEFGEGTIMIRWGIVQYWN